MESMVLNMSYKYLGELRASQTADFTSDIQCFAAQHSRHTSTAHCLILGPNPPLLQAMHQLCSQTVPPGQDGESWAKPGPFNRQRKQLTKGRRIFMAVSCTTVKHPGSTRNTLVVKLTLIKKTVGSGQISDNT